MSGRSKRYAWNTVEIRDSESGRVLHSLIGHTAIVSGAAFSPDGRRLATSSADRTIKLWDVPTGREVFTLFGHTSGVMGLAFSPDGHRIASGGLDSTARIWDATPLTAEVLRAQEVRYRQKLNVLSEITDATDDLQRAEIFEITGRWDLAAVAYSKAILSHPMESRYLLRRSRAYGKLGQWNKAEADVAKAVELIEKSAPNDFGLLAYQGHSCRILCVGILANRPSGKNRKCFPDSAPGVRNGGDPGSGCRQLMAFSVRHASAVGSCSTQQWPTGRVGSRLPPVRWPCARRSRPKA